MRRKWGRIGIVLALVALLVSLGVVTWRQSRALELSRAVEDARHARALEESEKARLEERIRELESRSRVVREASAKLGMRLPTAAEIVILPAPAAGADAVPDDAAPRASLVARARARLLGKVPGDAERGIVERAFAGGRGADAEPSGGAE